MKESCVISSRTTTFHHSLLCEHTLHFLHLQPPQLPQESCVCQAIFCWISTEPDLHHYTLRPCLHPPSSPWKSTFLCQRPFQRGLFNLTSFRPPISEREEWSCMWEPHNAVCSRGVILRLNYLFALSPQTHTNRGEVHFNNMEGFSSPLQSHIMYVNIWAWVRRPPSAVAFVTGALGRIQQIHKEGLALYLSLQTARLRAVYRTLTLCRCLASYI